MERQGADICIKGDTNHFFLSFVNTIPDENEEKIIRCSVNRGKPFGGDIWSREKIQKYELEATVRNRGRQLKGT